MKTGARSKNRTRNRRLTGPLLYQLSYTGILACREGFEPPTYGIEARSSDPLSYRQVKMERVGGIEPPSSAWKAAALPLSYTRKVLGFCYNHPRFFSPSKAPRLILPKLPSQRAGAPRRSMPLSRCSRRVSTGLPAWVTRLSTPQFRSRISFRRLGCTASGAWVVGGRY